MDEAPLTGLGLTFLQSRVYEAVALHGGSTTAAVAHLLGVPVEATARSIDELVRLGLVLRDLHGEGCTAAPVEPALDALAHARREELARAEAFARGLAERVAQEAQRHRPDQLVSVVTGEQAVRSVQVQVLRAAQEQVRVLDRPPYLTAVAEGGTGADPVQRERMAAGVTYRTVYDQGLFDDAASLARVRREIAGGEQGRVLADLPLKLLLADSAFAIVPLLEAGGRDEPAALLVRPSVLLDALAALFEALWRIAKPVTATAVADGELGVRQLVELLGTGLTEERLARLLGVSDRTVRRRLALARAELGAATMFQAGVEAARRGWV